MENAQNALEHFKIDGAIQECIPFGSGHINGTYRVTTVQDGTEKRYILQHINHNVFPFPIKVMHNIERVSGFLKSRVSDSGRILNFIPSSDGSLFYCDDDGDYWRMYEYIDHALALLRPDHDEFYECALAFGRFQRMLSDFPADSLYETIPDFHNTPKRYTAFLKSVEENRSGRADKALQEIAFVKSHRDFYPVLMDAHKAGELPLRVSHNDTKSNNVLLDETTHKAICVIDLDTIMPGFSVTDFGDAIRFGASTADEDEKDLSRVHFDMEKFRIYARGFIEGCGGELPESEIMLLPEGAKMMTAECVMRFLTDFLDGDVYFKTDYPEHNLVRCRTQLRLVEEMDSHWDEIKQFVKELL